MIYKKQTFEDIQCDANGNILKGTMLGKKHIEHIEDGIVGTSIYFDRIMAETMRQITKIIEFPLYTIDGNIAIIGDSTITGYPSYARIASYFNVGSGRKISDIAKPGDTIAGQLDKWKNTISTTDKSALNYVFVQIGLNDMQSLTPEAFRTQYKGLIAQIRADSPGAMIILGTMVPCKARWKQLAPSNWEEVQERWVSANTDIRTGYYDCDKVAFLHTEALGLDGNLRVEYDHGDHIHENANGGKIVAYSWYATAFGNI